MTGNFFFEIPDTDYKYQIAKHINTLQQSNESIIITRITS